MRLVKFYKYQTNLLQKCNYNKAGYPLLSHGMLPGEGYSKPVSAIDTSGFQINSFSGIFRSLPVVSHLGLSNLPATVSFSRENVECIRNKDAPRTANASQGEWSFRRVDAIEETQVGNVIFDAPHQVIHSALHLLIGHVDVLNEMQQFFRLY
jgi:hypothetical protein